MMRLKRMTGAVISIIALSGCGGGGGGGGGDGDGDGDGSGGTDDGSGGNDDGSGGSDDGSGGNSMGGDGSGGDDTGSGGMGLGGDPGMETDLTQDDLDNLGSSLRVEFEVVENIPAACPTIAPWGLCVDGVIRLSNQGGAWEGEGFSIHYSGIRRVLEVASDEFSITHISGDLHEIEPTGDFEGFAANETKQIPFQAEYWMISETDAMPRFYLSAPGLDPVIIANTDTENLAEFVTAFDTPEQMLRTPGDASVLATAATRFANGQNVMDLGAQGVATEIIPTPAEVALGADDLDLSAGVTISAPDLSVETVNVIKARLATQRVAVRASGGVQINVSVNSNDSAFVGEETAEAYYMDVDDEITIIGGDEAGAFYGLQSLIALLPGNFADNKQIPRMTVEYDGPRYRYRGAQIDLARNFLGSAAVLKVLDQMAAYKLNALHLHLTDDEGWRLEIPGLPELTEVGAARCHDPSEESCLMPQLGSGPFDDTSGTGHLSRAEFIQILRAAKARHIEVIPEFDMPGHARAAIKAMEARALTGDTTYLLSDPDDMSQYISIQNYTDGAINACMESTYTFLAKVMDEVKDMYSEAGATLGTWHVGGDEVGAGAWTASPACEFLFAESSEVAGPDDVHAYFVRRANELAMARGFGIRGWSDGLRKTVPAGETTTKVFLDPETDLLGNTASANWWGTLFWWDNAAYTLANAGFQVILTSPDFLYLDHPYEADPKERGYYWATRYTDLRKLFGYISGNLPANSQTSVDRQGNDYTTAFTAEGAVVGPLDEPDNIIGLEAALWSETVRTSEQLDYMVFPRLLVVAERAWHRAEWEPVDGIAYDAEIDLTGQAEDWERFACTLGYKELPKLGRAGVRYRIEVPGGEIDGDGLLQANVMTPGLTIEYLNGEGDFVTYDPESPPEIASTQIRARARDGRVGRAVAVP